jgi:hypothetical protein
MTDEEIIEKIANYLLSVAPVDGGKFEVNYAEIARAINANEIIDESEVSSA